MKKMLLEGASEINVPLTDKQVDHFLLYYDLLLEWNQKMNLTAITEPEEVIQKHFLDSLTCLETGLFFPGCRVIDVGTGAGFPSIPLKIAMPELSIVLLDSLQKRLTFLEEVADRLSLSGLSFCHARAEDAAIKTEYREMFDIAVARAVAPMNVLSELCLPFVKKGGYFVAMKGSRGEEEWADGKGAISLLGGETEKIRKTRIDSHTIISIKKIANTPKKYPRRAGIPSKKPLIG